MGGQSHPPLSSGQACRNCGAALTGRWCAQCGQRNVGEGERRLGHLLGEALSAATNLDSRFWRSFGALLFRPGRLTRDYVDGRRARWLGPVTLFLLVNLLYFLAPPLTDFSLSFHEQTPGRIGIQVHDDRESLSPSTRAFYEAWPGQLHSPVTAPLVETRVARRNAARLAASNGERGYTMADYARAYEARNSEVSKLLIVLHIPFVALALALLFGRKRWYFAEHLAAALHLFAFMVLLTQLLIGVPSLLARYWGGAWVTQVYPWLSASLGLLVLVYTVIALRRAYQSPWWWSAIAAAAALLALGAAHHVYRMAQFLTIFALT